MPDDDARLFGTIPMKGIPVSAKDLFVKKTKKFVPGELRPCKLCGHGDDLELTVDANGYWYVFHKRYHTKCPREWDKTYPNAEEAYIRWNSFDYKLY